MSELKEKDIEEHPYVKWLEKKLENAQQEIKEKSEGYAKVCARLHEQVIDLTTKDTELKQKLQQIVDELGHKPSPNERGELYQEGWLDAMSQAIRKFEELLKGEGSDAMKHKVVCAECGKTERIIIEKGKPMPDGWLYYGKLNVNACQTDKFFYKPKDPEKGFFGEFERVPNECYSPFVKPKYVELWVCKECDEVVPKK